MGLAARLIHFEAIDSTNAEAHRLAMAGERGPLWIIALRNVIVMIVQRTRMQTNSNLTGGGLPENVPRVLPHGVDARIELGSWPVPPLFRLVRELATGLDTHELHRTVNMGVGMVVVCAPSDAVFTRSSASE